jgi:hypothetical protein
VKRLQKKLALITLSILLVLSFVALASCVQTFTVPTLNQVTTSFTLNQGDQVVGNINVTGGLNNDINFNVTDPNGKTVPGQNYTLVSQTPFEFTAQTSGTYTLIFENPGLLPRSVSLDYLVKPATLGIPMDMLPTVIGAIIAIIVAVVIVVVLVSKRRNPQSV